MGFVFRLMIPLIMILLIYGYMMHGDKVLNFVQNAAPAKSKGIEGIGNAVTDKDVTVYQWVDDKGMKHFSSTPPEGKSVDALELSPRANVIQSVKLPVEEESKANGGSVTSILNSPYSPGGAKDMIDQTTNLKNTLEQQMMDQKRMLDEISGNSSKK